MDITEQNTALWPPIELNETMYCTGALLFDCAPGTT